MPGEATAEPILCDKNPHNIGNKDDLAMCVSREAEARWCWAEGRILIWQKCGDGALGYVTAVVSPKKREAAGSAGQGCTIA
jgi:hypothetical protein